MKQTHMVFLLLSFLLTFPACKGLWKEMESLNKVRSKLQKETKQQVNVTIRSFSLGGQSTKTLNINVSVNKKANTSKARAKKLALLALKYYPKQSGLTHIGVSFSLSSNKVIFNVTRSFRYSFSVKELQGNQANTAKTPNTKAPKAKTTNPAKRVPKLPTNANTPTKGISGDKKKQATSKTKASKPAPTKGK